MLKHELNEAQVAEMRRMKSYFPYRKVAGVLAPDGAFDVFACATMAKANNYARKVGGVVFVLEVAK